MQKNLGINLAILLMSLILVLTVSCQRSEEHTSELQSR